MAFIDAFRNRYQTEIDGIKAAGLFGPAVNSGPRPNRWPFWVTGKPWQQRFVLSMVGIRAAGGRQLDMVIGIRVMHSLDDVAGFKVTLRECRAPVNPRRDQGVYEGIVVQLAGLVAQDESVVPERRERVIATLRYVGRPRPDQNGVAALVTRLGAVESKYAASTTRTGNERSDEVGKDDRHFGGGSTAFVIPSEATAWRSAPASPRTAAASDVRPPTIASSSGHASPAVRPSSPAAAASWSATSSRFAWAMPAAATDSPGCRPAGSVPAALGSSGTDDKKGESSLRLACLL